MHSSEKRSGSHLEAEGEVHRQVPPLQKPCHRRRRSEGRQLPLRVYVCLLQPLQELHARCVGGQECRRHTRREGACKCRSDEVALTGSYPCATATDTPHGMRAHKMAANCTNAQQVLLFVAELTLCHGIHTTHNDEAVTRAYMAYKLGTIQMPRQVGALLAGCRPGTETTGGPLSPGDTLPWPWCSLA